MFALVPGPEEQPQGDGAVRMNRGVLTGKHVIQISFIDQDGKQVLPQGGPKIEFNMAEPPATAFFWSQNFIFNIAGLRLPTPGQYSFDVIYDGKIVSRIPLQGVQLQQPAQQG